MILYGSNGNPQIGSDLFVAEALGNAQGNLVLPGSEVRKAFRMSRRRSDSRQRLSNDDRGADPSAGAKIEFKMQPISAQIGKERQSLPGPRLDIVARQLRHGLFYRFRRLVIQHVTNGVCK